MTFGPSSPLMWGSKDSSVLVLHLHRPPGPEGLGAGAGEKRAQLQSLFSKDPSPACSPPTTATNPVLEKRLPSSSLETKAGHRVGVAREWAGPCRGGAKVVYLTVWSRRPHSRKAASPAQLPPLQDRTRHDVASGHQLQPQPRLDKAASNRCVRDKGCTHGLGTKRRHPWGGRESLSKSETPLL